MDFKPIRIAFEGDIDIKLSGDDIIITKQIAPHFIQCQEYAILDCSNMTAEELAEIEEMIAKWDEENL